MKRLILSLFGFLSLLSVVGTVYAVTPPKGITVSPTEQQVQLTKNQSTLTFHNNVTNNTLKPIIIQVSALDFTSLNQTGSVSFIDSGQSDFNKHGLANFISIGVNQIALIPHQSQTVPITIYNADQLSPGGHYGAIIYKVIGSNQKGVNNVSISQAVSSLIFLTTSGGGSQTLGIQSLAFDSSFATFPSSVNVVLQNTGNTQTIPRGNLQILNSQNKVVSQSQINTTSNLILPGSSRLFNFPINSIKSHFWPGHYTLKFFYRHDGMVGYFVYQKKFLYIGWPIITLTTVLLIIMLVLILRIFIPDRYYRAK